MSDLDIEDAICWGCKQVIEEGNVVSFGDGIWHLHCFRCAKCDNLIECDSNLLLLADGNPICQNCSYSCRICGKPILDEAIITGEETYHADCFRCAHCRNRIEGSLFAKTSQGIYCMTCFEKRKEAKRRMRQQLQNPKIDKSLPTLPIPPPNNSHHSPATLDKTEKNDSNFLNNVHSQANLRKNTDTSEFQGSLSPERQSFPQAYSSSSTMESNLPHRKHSLDTTITGSASLDNLTENRSAVVRKQAFDTEFPGLNYSDQWIQNCPSNDLRREFFIVREQLQKQERTLQRLQNAYDRTIEHLQQTSDELTQELTKRKLAESKFQTLQAEYESLRQSYEQIRQATLNKKIIHRNSQTYLPSPMKNLYVSDDQQSTARQNLLKEIIQHPYANRSDDLSSSFRSYKEDKDLPPNRKVSEDLTDDFNEHSNAQKVLPKKFKWAGNMFRSNKSSKKEELDKDKDSETRSIGSNTLNEGASSKLSHDGFQKTSQTNLTTLSSENTSPPPPPNAMRTHYFQSQTFLKPVKCDVCYEKIWNLQGKDYKCQSCGLCAHSKCVTSISTQCPVSTNTADSTFDGTIESFQTAQNYDLSVMFGTDLSKQVELEGGKVPWIVEKCIMTVEKKGLLFEGIYRKSAPMSEIRTFHKMLSKGEKPTLEGIINASNDQDLHSPTGEEIYDITTATSILKQYFRDLPNPLLTFQSAPLFIQAIRDDLNTVGTLQDAIHHLPKANQITLKYLISHLNHISQYAQDNKMTAKNLAVVFGPTILRGQNVNPDQEFSDMSSKNQIVEFLITHCHEIWPQNQTPAESPKSKASSRVSSPHHSRSSLNSSPSNHERQALSPPMTEATLATSSH